MAALIAIRFACFTSTATVSSFRTRPLSSTSPSWPESEYLLRASARAWARTRPSGRRARMAGPRHARVERHVADDADVVGAEACADGAHGSVDQIFGRVRLLGPFGLGGVRRLGEEGDRGDVQRHLRTARPR